MPGRSRIKVAKKPAHRAPAARIAAPTPLRSSPSVGSAMQAEFIQRLHPFLGNQAVQGLIRNLDSSDGKTPFARLTLQREDDEPEAKGEAAKAPPKAPAKEMIDKAKSVKVLGDSYKAYVKDVKGGKVEVLAQADFQKAYDNIYGKTKYAWDKYVKPGPGNLEGFADVDTGTNFINKDVGSVDVVPHEMLHNNTSADWTPFAGSELDEGTTEYLTIKAVKEAGYTASHSYPSQEGVVQELVSMTSEDLVMAAYFNGKTGPLKAEMEKKCKGTWEKFKAAMQAKDWAKAKGYLAAKE
jgi:hypothetical protein